MTIYDRVKEKLEKFPAFRERKLRGTYLTILALRDNGIEEKAKHEALSHQELSDFAISYDSYRHAWGDVTRECPTLRGKDYDEGEKLSQEHQVKLGYTTDPLKKELKKTIDNDVDWFDNLP